MDIFNMSFRLVFTSALRLVIRSRFIPLALFVISVTTIALLLAAQFSGRQPATVALDVGFSVVRLGLPLLIVLLTQELVSREFERRYYLASMTYPHPRHHWLLGRFAALMVLVLGLLIVLALLLIGLTHWVSLSYVQATPVSFGWPFWITIAFIAVDLLVITSVAFFLAVVSSTSSFVLIGTFGFLLIARTYATVIALLKQQAGLVHDPETYRAGLGILGYLLPDLGALDVRMLALYGKLELLPSDWSLVLTSGLAYATGFIWLATWALQRKRFA